MKTKQLILFVLCLSGAICTLAADKKQSADMDEFNGRVVDTANTVPKATSTWFTLKISKYTTDEEMLKFAAILKEKGPDGLIDAIKKLENGRVRIGSRLSYPVAITRQFQKEGKRIVRVLTDRPIAFGEAFRSTRSTDYPFGIVELSLDSEGKGEGSLIAAAKIEFEGNMLEVENYSRAPFRVLNVTSK